MCRRKENMCRRQEEGEHVQEEGEHVQEETTTAVQLCSSHLMKSLFFSIISKLTHYHFHIIIPCFHVFDFFFFFLLTKEKKEHRTLGPHCGSDAPRLNASSGLGHVHKLGDLDSYVTGSPHAKRAVILASDVYGYTAPNLRKLADKIAAAGFFVAVPDFFHGDPLKANSSDPVKDAWMKRHTPEKGFEEAKPIIKDLKSKGFSAIGAAGFCWGAKVAIELAKLKDYVQAAAIIHPSFVTLDDIKHVKVPLAILGAELDGQYPPKVIKQFEEVLIANKIDHFVKVYQGVKHGFSIRYDVLGELARERAMEAQEDLLKWFTKNVK